jgi:hypothetical protein
MDEPVRVKFGPRDDDSVPLSWAETMLKELLRRRAPLFRALLGDAATGADNAK